MLGKLMQLNCDLWHDRAEDMHNRLLVTQDENAKLRIQLADMTERIGRLEKHHAKTFEVGKRWMAKAARFEGENAKLRELVAEMFNACPMCVNCAHNHLTVGWYDRMRELGVDVD